MGSGVRVRLPALAFALTAVWAAGADAQYAPTRTARLLPPMLPAAAEGTAPPHGPVHVALRSAVLPGAGQRALGLRRWAPYVAVEALGWIWFVDRRRTGHALTERYRDLAWTVARGGEPGPRRDGDFSYYEALGRYRASGSYDADPHRPGVQPERDESTFNGAVWALARGLYSIGEDPDEGSAAYQQALEYYLRNAVGPELAWSWAGADESHARYRELMHSSDEARRSATRALGLILANHVLSAVDALVTARLLGPRHAAAPIRIDSEMDLSDAGPTWNAMVRVTWPMR